MQLFNDVVAPPLAPACFAAASVFSHDAAACRQCGAFSECSGASLKTLEAIQSTIDVKDILRRHSNAKRQATVAMAKSFQSRRSLADAARDLARQEEEGDIAITPTETAPTLPQRVERKTRVEVTDVELTADEIALVNGLPKKAAEHAVRFIKRGTMETMREQMLAGVNPFAESKPEFMRVVCDALIAGGSTRRGLKQRLATDLDWGDAAASSHISQVASILLAFKIAAEEDGVLRLIPTAV